MSKHWIEKYDKTKHSNKMWGVGLYPEEKSDNILEPHNVYFVRECGFTFEFHNLEQLFACKEHFSKKIQPSTRIAENELWKYGGDSGETQRWFEKFPKGLRNNHQRPKILKALERAINDFNNEKSC